jgi:DNA-directed RNA polymerase subunit H (RpoH/RPB5)
MLHTPPSGENNGTYSMHHNAGSNKQHNTDIQTCVGSNTPSILQCVYAQQKGKLTESVYAELLDGLQTTAQACIDLLAQQQPNRNLSEKINKVILITNLQVSKMKRAYVPHEIVHVSHLLFNREKMLIHSHVKTQTTTETSRYMRAYNTTPEHLPKILSSDPYVHYLGLQQYTGVVTTTDNIRVTGQLQGLRNVTRSDAGKSTELLASFPKMKSAKCNQKDKLQYQALAWDKCQSNEL